MKIKPTAYHIALVTYCLIIFILSSIPGEEFPKVDFEFSDKIVHAVIYAVLYVLFFYSLKYQSKYVKLQKFAPEYSLLFTSLYGVTDEIHQYFVMNRSCEFSDWIADTAGALIIYILFKMTVLGKKRITSVLFLLSIILIVSGCSGNNNTVRKDSPVVKLESTEAWLDFMPVVGDEDKNRFGFVIRMNISGRSPDTNYTVSDFKISLNNDTLLNKRFNIVIENYSDSGYIMNITHVYNENYLDKNKSYPEEAEFSLTINKADKLISKITTPKIKILKTQ